MYNRGMDADTPGKKFAELLERGLLELDQREGRRHTITEYANRIGVNQPMLSRLMATTYQSRPDLKSLLTFSEYFGPQVWDIWGIEIPISDPVLKAIYERWQNLPPEVREEIYRIVTREEPPA